MSERKDKKIRRLQRRIVELEGENDMLRVLLRSNTPLDAEYAPIPTGHKPGFFRRLWKKIFG